MERRKTDDYSYVAAAKTAIEIFEFSARRTGRTARMIERLKQGDRVYVVNAEQARYLTRRIHDAGKSGIDVRIFNGVSHMENRAPGRVYLDHALQMNWVKDALDAAASRMAEVEDALSCDPSKREPIWPKEEFTL